MKPYLALLALAGLGLAAAGVPSPARAEAPSPLPGSPLPGSPLPGSLLPGNPMSTQALDQARGGFITVNGLQLGIGLNIQTLVDGKTIMESTLLPTGSLGGFAALSGVAAGLTAPSGQMPTGSINTGSGQVQVMGLNPANLAKLINGVTTVIANSENNKVIQQNVATTVVVPNYQALTAANAPLAALGPIIRQSLVGALAH